MYLPSPLLCLAGFAALAIATERQQQALLGRVCPPRVSRGLRIGGASLLLVALLRLVDDRGWGLGLVAYSGYTSVAAGVVYCALIVATRRRRRNGR
jgi:hypothetical protein